MKNTANDKKTENTEAPRNNPANEDPQNRSQEKEENDFSAAAIALQNGKKLCCKNSDELNLKLCNEKTTLESQIKQLTKLYEEKVTFIRTGFVHVKKNEKKLHQFIYLHHYKQTKYLTKQTNILRKEKK